MSECRRAFPANKDAQSTDREPDRPSGHQQPSAAAGRVKVESGAMRSYNLDAANRGARVRELQDLKFLIDIGPEHSADNAMTTRETASLTHFGTPRLGSLVTTKVASCLGS